jgi:hypothetical protein
MQQQPKSVAERMIFRPLVEEDAAIVLLLRFVHHDTVQPAASGARDRYAAP